jgi:hypothetical protein
VTTRLARRIPTARLLGVCVVVVFSRPIPSAQGCEADILTLDVTDLQEYGTTEDAAEDEDDE